MEKSFVKGERPQMRGYSSAVITSNPGKTIWLAGHTGSVRDDGTSLAGDFEAQCRQTFANVAGTLAECGAKLSDMVTMTVFLIDARYTTRMTEIRREIFGDNFPGSAAITVTGFANPSAMIEIQGIAVLP